MRKRFGYVLSYIMHPASPRRICGRVINGQALEKLMASIQLTRRRYVYIKFIRFKVAVSKICIAIHVIASACH
jgi:hypothetical protein